MFLHGLEVKTITKILSDRAEHGLFKSLDDFIERLNISVEQTALLIKINAFRFTGINKRELLWEAHLKTSKTTLPNQVINLFETKRINFKTPELPSTTLENAFDALELLGFPLCNPFGLLEQTAVQPLRATELPKFKNRIISIEGYLITVKNTRTSNGKYMHFGTFLDYDGHFIDTVHFPPVASKYPFRGKGIYTITGKVIEEFDCITIEVMAMEKLAIIQDPRYSDPSPKFITQNKKHLQNPIKNE